MDAPRRIGLMGGTFNPVHTGHLLLAETAYEEAALDQVWFLPSGCPYKKREEGVLDAEHRLAMTKLAISDNPHFELCDMETKRSGDTYTFETLQELNALYPSDSFYFIMGADCLFSIEYWKNPAEIFARCTLLAAVRNGTSTDTMQEKIMDLENRFSAKILLLPFDGVDISSSAIRDAIKQGKSIRYKVPESVRRYIEQNHIYQ